MFLIARMVKKRSNNRCALRNFNSLQAHEFEDYSLNVITSTFCSFCTRRIYWGTGSKCKYCFMTIHKKCVEKVFGICVKNPLSSERTVKRGVRFKLNVSHRLRESRFFTLKFCNHCGTSIGPLKNGYTCIECKMNYHASCKGNVPKTCGICVNEIYKVLKNLSFKNEALANGHLKVAIKDFEIIELIGQGGFACVYKVKTRHNKIFALKVLQKDSILLGDSLDELMMEKDVWIRASKNHFIIQLFCAFQSNKHLFYLIEYAQAGNLMQQLEAKENFNEIETQFYASEIVCALEFLHQNSIIYRDLKLENVLLMSDGHIKLTDFGLSKMVQSTTDTFCGTAECMAPEIARIYFMLSSNSNSSNEIFRYDYRVDFFSLGILMFHMITGESAFSRSDDKESLKAILNEEPTYTNFRMLSSNALKCIRGFLEKNPKNRLGCVDSPYGSIRTQEFFAGLDWLNVETRSNSPPVMPIKVLDNDFEKHETNFLDSNEPDFLSELFKDFNFISENFK